MMTVCSVTVMPEKVHELAGRNWGTNCGVEPQMSTTPPCSTTSTPSVPIVRTTGDACRSGRMTRTWKSSPIRAATARLRISETASGQE
jgi:hypothetical protein